MPKRNTIDCFEAPLRLIKKAEVMSRTGKSHSGLYLAIKEGNFPRQIQIGPRAVAWAEHEVNDWISDRMASRTSN